MKNLIPLYKKLYLIRYVELLIANNYEKWIFRCPTHLSIGQEASAVGICNNLTSSDVIFSNHRSHAHYLAKGGSLYQLFCELLGTTKGCSKGQGGSMHLIDQRVGFLGSTSIVGGTIPVAAGYSLGEKFKQTNNITIIFLGDGAIEEGVTFETLNWASTHNLPILFCLEDNNYACYTPKHIRQNINYQKLCESLNIKYYQCSTGHNLPAIHELSSTIISNMRLTPHPTFLHINLHRRYEHCGFKIDDDLNYREPHEISSWPQQDPVYHFKHSNLLPENKILEVEQQVKKIVDKIFIKAKKSSIITVREHDEFLYY